MREESRERDTSRREKPEAATVDPDAPLVADTQTSPPREREEAPKPAVSLWHKIFGAPAEQPKRVEPSRRPEPIREEEIPDDRDYTAAEDKPAPSKKDFTGGSSADDFDFEQDREVAEDEASERKRSRSHRRRRGGRGRGRKTSERSESASGDDEREDAPLFDEAGDGEFEEVETAEAEDIDESTDSGDLSNGDAHDELRGSEPRRRKAERAIPSWDDAIGFIVDSNLQTRSQRRPARSQSRGDSSRDQSRGRSRGRRKK